MPHLPDHERENAYDKLDLNDMRSAWATVPTMNKWFVDDVLITVKTSAMIVTDYNMTVWILAGNYISFTIAAGLIRLHMPGVKKSRV